VIPRGIFDPKSQSTIRVPACRPCNELKSRNEDYVRDWLCSHHEVDDTAIPPRIYAAFVRSSRSNKSKLARTAVTRGRYVHTYTKHGLYMGKLLKFDLEAARIVTTFELIAQGVYFDVTREHLSKDGVFDVGYVPRTHIAEQVQMLKALDATTNDLGNGTCSIIFAADRTPGRVVARVLLAFYNKSVAVDVLYARGPTGRVDALEMRGAGN
jgi:hypothetical protein